MTGQNDARGFTLIELLLVVAIIGILAAIAVPSLLRSRIAANEASAISTMRAVSSANFAYHGVCGGYAVAFTTLLTNRYLPEPLVGANPVKSGYQFGMIAGVGAVPSGSAAGMCVGAQSAFFTTAMPTSAGTGRRSFALREVGTIFQDVNANPIADPPTVGGSVALLY